MCFLYFYLIYKVSLGVCLCGLDYNTSVWANDGVETTPDCWISLALVSLA